MRYWMFFAFLAAVLVVPSMQQRRRCNERKLEFINEENGNCQECGISSVYKSTIVNGEIVDPTNKFPWMVTLSVDGGKICGASIISEYFVMTAAHCTKNKDITRKLGENTCAFENGRKGPCYYGPHQMTIAYLTNTYQMTDGQGVSAIIPHPGYEPDKRTVKNDIALIRMSKNIQCSNYARPICLHDKILSDRIGMPVVVAGWGATMDPKGRGKEQRATTLVVEDFKECKMYAGFTPEGNVCLSGKGYSSACFGDSGGPAFFQRRGKFFAIGVASATTSKKCDTNKPLIYTSVAYHMRWIKAITGVDYQNN